MEGLGIPRASEWLVAARRPSGSDGGEAGARRLASVILLRRAWRCRPHGSFASMSVWRRALTSVAPALRRRSSPFPAFPSAEKPEKEADDKDVETPDVQIPTANEPGEEAAAVYKPARAQKHAGKEYSSPPASATTENAAELGESQPAIAKVLVTGLNSGVTSDQTLAAGEPAAPAAVAEAKSVPVETRSTVVQTETPPPQDQTQTQTQDQDDAPTGVVRVRFVLEKACKFGEQFLVVGEDPKLGSWNPTGALPLTWSEGHVWVADDVDFPAGKEVKFKFVLRELSGKIKWQPGPDRVLQTAEAPDTVVVKGDWEHADDQETGDAGPRAAPAEGDTEGGGEVPAEDKEAADVTGPGGGGDGEEDGAEEKHLPPKGDADAAPATTATASEPGVAAWASAETGGGRAMSGW